MIFCEASYRYALAVVDGGAGLLSKRVKSEARKCLKSGQHTDRQLSALLGSISLEIFFVLSISSIYTC